MCTCSNMEEGCLARSNIYTQNIVNGDKTYPQAIEKHRFGSVC